jgi:hypothetical protein
MDTIALGGRQGRTQFTSSNIANRNPQHALSRQLSINDRAAIDYSNARPRDLNE